MIIATARIIAYKLNSKLFMTTEITQKLTSYIQNNIIPLYDNFDVAHDKNHVNIVINESLKLADFYDVNKAMVYTIAAYHDLGLKYGRENHHIDSGKIIESDEVLCEWFSKEQIKTIKEAVEDHRASLSHKPRTIYGCIVAEADRDINPSRIFRRTIQFGLIYYSELTIEEHYERFCKHMDEKYVEGGYLSLLLPESSNTAQLIKLRDIIADKTQLYTYFEKIYKNEIV